MTTIELKTKDLQKIYGGTEKEYNNGHELGAKLLNVLKNAASYHFRHCYLY